MPISLALPAQFVLATACYGAFVTLPLPDIRGDGIAKYAVFNGAAVNDTLLWKSGEDAAKNRFRVWSLEAGLYYGVTFGMKDDVPGQLTAFCGYNAGRNIGKYDLAGGKLELTNKEPSFIEDQAGLIVNLPTGKVKVKKGMAKITSVQGEYVDAAQREFFTFAFDTGAATGPAMTHDLFVGGPQAGHPANYNANKVNLTQALTVANMFGAFENGAHRWNPQPITTMLIDFPDKWEFECQAEGGVCGTPLEQDIMDYVSTTQPRVVPEPATLALLIVGLAALLPQCRRR
ncbi:MAG: PEP-CTERM sorting domain-containing protein [Planctomycetes bacterium]|nr:PEP-CTERM sorting domain-containing protein [Planctomycetota bacterium]